MTMSQHSSKLRHGHTKYFEIVDMNICRNGIEYAKMTQFDFQNLFCNFVFDFSDFLLLEGDEVTWWITRLVI